MRRIVFGALTGAAVMALAGVAAAQSGYVTYGQPTVQDYRYAQRGPTAVVEVDHRAYAATGAWADGRGGYGYGYDYGPSHDRDCRDRCGGGYPPPPPPPGHGCYDRCDGPGHGRSYGGHAYAGGYAYAGGHAYSRTSHWSERRGHWTRYQPYAGGHSYGGHDRGGRYGYGVSHDGRGYYERDGYHDDRPPGRRGHGGRDRHDRGCDCYTILDDR